MATPNPTPGGAFRRPRPHQRLGRTIFNIVALGAVTGAPVGTVSLWLLLTDPTLAGEVADTGSILPVARELLYSVGRAIAAVLAFI